MTHPVAESYFVVPVNYGGKLGSEAVVDPFHSTWTGVLATIREAASDNHAIPFVHEIKPDGTWVDRSEEAFAAVMTYFADEGEPLTYNEYSFIEEHVSMQAAQCFKMEEA